MGHLFCFRFVRRLLLGVLAAVAFNCTLCVSPAYTAPADLPRALSSLHALVAVEGTDSPGETVSAEKVSDSEEAYRQEYLERSQRRRLHNALVLLGVILLILALWWSWGKVLHRRPKL